MSRTHQIVFSILFMSNLLFSQSENEKIDYKFNPIVVTAHRAPVQRDQLARHVTIVTREEIESSAGQSLSDLLAGIAGLDVQRRGALGMQADVGMRGASFEGTLVLLDGVRLNNPQTAHLNFDLPISLQNIQRIEILRGGSSAVYGADAVGGVINIITRDDVNQTAFQVTGGQFGLYDFSGMLTKRSGRFSHQVSGGVAHSDGFTKYTASDRKNIFYKANYSSSRFSAKMTLGFENKEFHANSFYSDQFPNEWEHTRSMLTSFVADYSYKNIAIKPRLSTRQHFDDFILDNARPEWYRNKHRTITTSFEMPLYWDTPVGQWAAFGEIRQERISSSNLGDHEREIVGLTATYTGNVHQKYFAHVAVHHHYFAAWGWRTWPHIDLSMKVNSDLTLFVSHGSAFRMPSFTDLYYTSPANMGNPDLHFEESKSVEGGIRLITGKMSWVTSVFQRSGTNLIDWIRMSNELPWIATNIASIRTHGVDVEWQISPHGAVLKNMSVGYTFLTSDKEEQIHESKYALNYIRHHAHLKFSHNLFFGIESGWTLNWRDRINQPSYILTDLKLQKKIGRWRVFIDASNLFDKRYFEIPGVPRPGRWIEGGLAGMWN